MAKTVIYAIRLEPEMAARVVAVAKALSKRAAGAVVTRSHVARMAVERGLGPLEKEIGIVPKRRKRKK